MAFEARNLFRKEELDWKMVYLAREPGADFGEICWKLDLKSCLEKGIRIRSVLVLLNSAIFETGKVTASCCIGDLCKAIPSKAIDAKFA